MLLNTSNNSFTTPYIAHAVALWEENEKLAQMVLPAIVFIGILIVIGILGNILVVYIYGFIFENSTQNFLITCLACFDLLMGAIGMPADIADLRFSYVFEYDFVCKSMKFFNFFTTNCSVLTLLTIAIDRHRRVTKPLIKQMSIREAKCYLLFNITLAIIGASPTLVLMGLRQRETKIPGLYGCDCSFNEEFHNTTYPVIFNAFCSTMFLIFSSIIGVLYFKIWKRVKTHRLFMQSKATNLVGPSLRNSTLIKGSFINKTSSTKENSNSENYFEDEILILKPKKRECDVSFINSSVKTDLKHVPKMKSNEPGSSKTYESQQCLNSRNYSMDNIFNTIRYFISNKKECDAPSIKSSASNDLKPVPSEPGFSKTCDSLQSLYSRNYSMENGKNVKKINVLKDTEVNNSSSVDIESIPTNRNLRIMGSLYTIYNASTSKFFKQEIPRCDQTTKVAFTVSAVFILSFLPTFTLMLIRSFNIDVYDNLQGTTLWIYNIFVRFYLFNAALNPIVYGLLNEKFRLECKRIVNSCVCRIHSVILGRRSRPRP